MIMDKILGCWKCISINNSVEENLYVPEKIFVEIRKVRVFKEMETHIDIADYREALLLRGKVSQIKQKFLYSSMQIDINLPEKIELHCDFSITKDHLKLTYYGKEKRIFKMILARQEGHLF